VKVPTYEYACSLCRHEWELEQSIKEPPVDHCARCGAKTAVRLISRTSFVLKGEGWSPMNYSKLPGS
jgi:putative FmdB family regulatory protein